MFGVNYVEWFYWLKELALGGFRGSLYRFCWYPLDTGSDLDLDNSNLLFFQTRLKGLHIGYPNRIRHLISDLNQLSESS